MVLVLFIYNIIKFSRYKAFFLTEKFRFWTRKYPEAKASTNRISKILTSLEDASQGSRIFESENQVSFKNAVFAIIERMRPKFGHRRIMLENQISETIASMRVNKKIATLLKLLLEDRLEKLPTGVPGKN